MTLNLPAHLIRTKRSLRHLDRSLANEPNNSVGLISEDTALNWSVEIRKISDRREVICQNYCGIALNQ